MDTVLINDVKKGWEVLTGMGIAVIQDNKKGIRRMIQYKPDQGLFDDIGDEYVYKFRQARENENSEWMKITFTPAQQKQIAKIRMFGF